VRTSLCLTIATNLDYTSALSNNKDVEKECILRPLRRLIRQDLVDFFCLTFTAVRREHSLPKDLGLGISSPFIQGSQNRESGIFSWIFPLLLCPWPTADCFLC
jgi:hypothetical protein